MLMMEFLGSFVEIGKAVSAPIIKWLRYSSNLDENLQSLRRNIEDLSNQEDDIKAELMNAEIRLRKRQKRVVEVWLKEVQKIKDDVQKIEQVVVGGTNYISRVRFGKLIVEKLREVATLQGKGKFSDGLLVSAFPRIGQIIPTVPLGGGATVDRNIENIWTCLMSDEVQKIGVFGMGGVGKTTIMHHINNQLLGMPGKFHNVIWVTVSDGHSVVKLQNQIAATVNLDLSNYMDETSRASKLYAILSQMSRYVLILDDLWEAFPLEKVGFPEPTRLNGCKLVLTTRSLEVCRKMECKPIKLELLSEQEALNLFMSKVAPQAALPPELLEIAKLLARECGCLPFAVIAVAGGMKGVDDIHEWRNVLHELSNCTHPKTSI